MVSAYLFVGRDEPIGVPVTAAVVYRSRILLLVKRPILVKKEFPNRI